MAEPLSGAWPEQLAALLERLRQEGFRIGVPETLRLHQLLLALVERRVPLDTPQRLTRLLGPVLCRSASEQEAFGRQVEQWWPGPVVPEAVPAPAPAAPAAALEEALVGVERRRRRLLRWLPSGRLALAITAAVAAAAVAGVLLPWQPQRPIRPAPEIKAPPRAADGPAADVSGGSAAPGRGPKPEAPKPAAPETLARDDGLFLLPSEIAGLSLLAALLSLLAVQGAVRLWWWRQARLVLQRLPLQGDPQLHRIALQEIERDLVPLPDLQRISRALNSWQRLPSEELDGAATVEASLRRGGWLSPRYGQRRQRLSYLFLLDQESLSDQQTRHLRAWLERLREEGVLADWVCFQRQPVYCHGPTGQGPLRSLAELAAQHPEAVAVVVADGERFFSPVDGALQPWLRELAAWPRHAVLTPRPSGRWGGLEAELAGQLPVLPASPEGLLRLGQWLEGVPPPPLETAGASAAPEPPLLQGSAAPWLDRTAPAAEVVRELLVQLRAFLGREGFFWLAACAVFPELHWTITAYLGQRLQNDDGDPLLHRCPLLRLARLPWLRHGFLPDWLRLALIQTLEPPQEAAVRERLVELLLAAVEGGEVDGAALRVATAHGQSLPRLLPPLLEQLRRRASPVSPLRDQLLLRFLQNRPLLAADAPESLRRVLRDPPSPPLAVRWWRPWSLGGRELAAAGLVLLGLAGLSLVGVREVQRLWLDHLLRAPAAPAVSGAEQTARLRRGITALGLSRSSLMRLGPDPELQRVERALALESGLHGLRLATLRGHQGTVLSAAFSGDGSRIVSAGADGTMRLWDGKSGQAIGEPLRGHQGVVWSAAFSGDGSRIVSAGDDGTVRLWDGKSGKAIGEPLRGHQGMVLSAAFSGDGSRIVSAGLDGTVRLWDGKSGQAIGEPLRGHQGEVFSAAFSGDGSRIVSAGDDGTVRLWDGKSGQAIGEPLRGHQGTVLSAAFSGDGSRIVSAGADGTMRLWDGKSGQAIGEPLRGHQGVVWSAAFSGDGSRIVSAGADGTMRLWDGKSGQAIGEPLRGHQGTVLSAAFSGDGSRIVSAGADGTMRLWDGKSGQAIGEPLRGHQSWVFSAAFSGDGSRIVSAGEDGTVRLWGLSPSPAEAYAPAKAGTTPDWRRTLPIACAKLEFSQPLNSLPWLNTARATCQHFVWSQRPRQSAGFGAGLAALGVGALAAGGLLWRRRQGLRAAAANHDKPADARVSATTAAKRVLDRLRQAKVAPVSAREAARKVQEVPLKPRLDARNTEGDWAANRLHSPSEPPPPPPPPALLTWTVPTAQLLRVGSDWQVQRSAVEVRGYREALGEGLDLPMLQIPAGRFLMGSPPEELERSPAEGPQHEVELASFFIGQTPITQAQWREVAEWQERPGERWDRKLKANPSRFVQSPDRDHLPVEQVSWEDAMEFCRRLSQRTGRTYALPSEAQWEYACRAGTGTPFAFGETITSELANYDGGVAYANGPKGVNRLQTTPAGSFPANAWGLQDMHGNVSEWCLDHWHGNYEGAPIDGSAWLNKRADASGMNRLLRGGSWYGNPGLCRSAYRNHFQPDYACYYVGFRAVCLPQGPSLNP